ncbi:MAG: family 10 glycosylhydrolase [Victivallales bacterium]
MTLTGKIIAAVILGAGLAVTAHSETAVAKEGGSGMIEIKMGDFISTNYLIDDKEREEIRKSGILRGFGEAEYAFETKEDAWWELWGKGGVTTPFDLLVDKKLVIHSPISSGVWAPENDMQKMMNLNIPAGRHTLMISRPEPYGIPYIGGLLLKKSKDLAGMVRAEPARNVLAIRKDEKFGLALRAGKSTSAQSITIKVARESATEPSWTKKMEIPAGTGVFETEVAIPSAGEGVFDITLVDDAGKAVDRTIQYLVVDVKDCPKLDKEPKRELVQEIDCSKAEPTYSSGTSRVVESSIGAYRETGDRGRMEHNMDADWFAYTLNLPGIQDLYLAEVDYPDDDERIALVSILERCPNPYALTLGYMSGGIYSFSNSMLTEQIYFYPREKDPRLFLQTWKTGARAAAAKIRIYRLDHLPPAMNLTPRGRSFGMYQEENIRFTSYFGAAPDGNGWSNFYKTAYRLGAFQKFLGANLWQKTIANYQAVLWPCTTIKGYGSEDEGGWCVTGPLTLKEPFKKDIVRMQLLVCEKFGMDYVGELHVPGNMVLMKELDARFGGKGIYEDDGPHKPWLTVSKDGECGMKNPHKPYWNPLYPAVQDWMASVVSELAGRYKDSPAFKGVSLRLMAWCFSSWQAIPSIKWGYEDWTIALFQKETGISIPVPPDSPDRFTRRYEWLMANAYDKWVEWRCRKIYSYHSRLAKILTDARPDLKLHLIAYSPMFEGAATETEWNDKGWAKLIKETGIDTDLYRKEPAMDIQGVDVYPSCMARSRGAVPAAFGMDVNMDGGQAEAAAHDAGGGTVSSLHLDADSLEGQMVEGVAVGYDPKLKFSGGQTSIHGAGIVNASGIHFLERFAEAMAKGNPTLISDGSHGYAQGQPRYLRPFLAEYRSLPAIGMKALEKDGDPVAVWQGDDGKTMFFYVVNRLDQPLSAVLRIEGKADIRRLSTNETVKLENGEMKIKLGAYEMLSFEGGAVGVHVADIKAALPEALRPALLKQIAFAEALASGKNAGDAPIMLSPVELRKAKEKLAEAKTSLDKGRAWTVRRILLSADLVKLYEAFHSYPPSLFYKKAPYAPKGAMLPESMLKTVPPAGRTDVSVRNASGLAPSLSGLNALCWKGDSISFDVPSSFDNRYRMEMVYVNHPPFTVPKIRVDGKEVSPPPAETREEGVSWGRFLKLETLSLQQGVHKVELTKAPGADAAILFLNLEPVPRDLEANDWMAMGPFDGTPDPRVPGSLAKVMELQQPPEKSIDFSSSYDGLGGKKISWKRPGFSGDYVDFYKLTGEYCFRIGYAVCRFDSPASRDAEICFGVDYWGRIWLNGKEVFSKIDAHGSPHKGQFSFPVKLLSGKNEIMVKLHAGAAGNGFWMSITDPGDLKISIQ